MFLDGATGYLMATDPSEMMFILLAWLGIRGLGGGWNPSARRNVTGDVILVHVFRSWQLPLYPSR